MMLLYIIIATWLITLCVLIGLAFTYVKREKLKQVTLYLVALSAGALMGGAFLHLLPESLEVIKSDTVFIVFLLSFLIFFLIEKYFHWRHCHDGDCPVHIFGYMNLVGDSIHNFIDGLVIASTFMIDVGLGISTTLVVAIHEIPQEIGDYGVLIHAGYNHKRALFLNYVVSLTVVLGGIVGYYFFSYLDNFLPYLLPLAAGGFVYIAASDLMPEIKKELNVGKSINIFFIFFGGMAMMYLIKIIGH